MHALFRQGSNRHHARRGRVALAIAALTFCAAVHAQTRTFDIAAGDMKSALEAYVAQSGVQLIYRSQDVRDLSTRGVQRAASVEDALQALIAGSPLRMRRDASGAVVLFVNSGTASDRSSGVQVAEQLDSVVVTADRRREPVREVPQQVNILSADELQRAGAKSVTDYLTTQAGVELRSEGGAGFGNISIRGVTTGTQVTPTVGVYVDDVSVGSSSAFVRGSLLFLDLSLLDLNHIELLRGPQGTLYGASSIGGLLKYVTNEPDTHELSGKLGLGTNKVSSGGISDTENVVVNVPIKEDVAAIRLSAYHDHSAGWIDATGPAAGGNINRGDSRGARASILITPTTDLTVRLTATSQDIHRGGLDFVDYNPTTGRPVAGDLSRQLSLREPYRIKTDEYAADLEYDLGFARFNSISSSQKLRHESTIDATSVYVPLLAQFGINVATVAINAPVQLTRNAQEFRLTSKSDKFFEYLAGLYFDKEIGGNQQTVPTALANGSDGPNLATFDLPSQYKEYAAFGDLTVKPVDGLAATAGLRVARNQQVYRQNSFGPLAGGTTALVSGSAETVKTYLGTVSYAIDPINNVYARYATGYRPGGPNAVPLDIVTHLPLAPTTFVSDHLSSYEIGYKADLLDKRLSLQAALYDIEWRDIQQQLAVNGVGVIVNGGRARVKGSELSATYRPDEHWSLGGNAAYVDAYFRTESPGIGAHAGQRVPDTAKYSASVFGNYLFALLDHPAYAGATFRFIGARDAGVPGSTSLPSFVEHAYSLTDLQAGVSVDRFNVAVFARNVFDRRAVLSTYTAFLPLGGNALVSVAQPRTVGITVGASF